MIEVATDEIDAQKRALQGNMRTLMKRVDNLMSCLFVSYNVDLPNKTIFAIVYLKKNHEDEKFVVATGSANVYYNELIDIPRGERSAYKKALDEARNVLTNFVLMENFINIKDHTGSITYEGDMYHTLNISKNQELVND